MAFENSPKLKNPSKPVRTFSGWVYSLRVALLGFTVLLVVFDFLFLAYKIEPDWFTRPSGGLDGCIATSSGAPVAATVWVDNNSRSTFEDGCFFFASLTPGEHQFQVQTEAGIVYIQTVDIPSDQAIGLGIIQIGP
ncbi:MAG: carboxypeptidase regulatory-like domain-containing protein [Anaerolineales bacterium]|nr:carboxypeptidase regulatory-like domain-containing protein [Anaerolineales bacterium]